MADNQTPTVNLDYVTGYKAGLAAGFDQGIIAQAATPGPSNARKVAAWFVLGAGLAGAAGVILGSRRSTLPLGTTVLVGSSIATAFITSLQLLTAGRTRL